MVNKHKTTNPEVNEALEQFSDWSMPWAYMRETMATNGLTINDVILVEEVWQEANSFVHWTEPSIEAGVNLAASALRAKYSWLSEEAICNLVRGAAYQWR